jgi:folate-binding protein YgfZ
MSRISPLEGQHRAYAETLRRAAEARMGLAEVGPEPPGGGVAHDVDPETAVEHIPYGPSGGSDEESDRAAAIELVSTFGPVEAEYAAIRKGAGLMDCPHRGAIRVRGRDRRDFLNRMLTQELKDLAAGDVRRAFLVNRKGRIDADLTIVHLDAETWLEVDVHQAVPAAASLQSFLFAEDVAIEDVSEQFHMIGIHGKLALDVLTAARSATAAAAGIDEAQSRAAWRATIAGADVIIARSDETGEPGLHLIVRREDAETAWRALLDTDATVGRGKHRVRPIGWYAYNIARIEAGTPLFNIDFGPTNLPHETGVLRDHVSFTKGCYPGQEVVARMEMLGQPKQVLVGLRIEGDLLPVAGGQVFEAPQGSESDSLGSPIGAVTSSTLSPMLGGTPVAFAMVRTADAAEGSGVVVNAEGKQVRARVSSLRFWAPAGHRT